MKHILVILLLLGGICVLLVICVAVKMLTPPNFRVSLEHINDVRRLRLVPNFVVNRFMEITVSSAAGDVLIANSEVPRSDGPRTIVLPNQVESGDVLTIRCELQYDQPMPSVRTVERRITID